MPLCLLFSVLNPCAELIAQRLSCRTACVASACLKIIFIALSNGVGPLCDLSRRYLRLTLTLSHSFRYLVTSIFIFLWGVCRRYTIAEYRGHGDFQFSGIKSNRVAVESSTRTKSQALISQTKYVISNYIDAAWLR